VQRVVLINVVGLSRRLLEHAPHIRALGEAVTLRPVLPAVTCSVQASMLTGLEPAEHGIVGNGWYDRETCEVRFWQRSGRLVQGEPVWEAMRARDTSATTLNMFWWFNAYSTCDAVVQARPMYPADGRKIPDCYSQPGWLRDRLTAELGGFPLFRFWGPMADITSSRWITDATVLADRWLTDDGQPPTLTLVYLPHLDYDLQRLGPDDPGIVEQVSAVDELIGRLREHYEPTGVRVAVVSEYGIEACGGGRSDASLRSAVGFEEGAGVAVNRVLRGAGHVAVREELGRELLDPGASSAFAVADHQVAHVYVADRPQGGPSDVLRTRSRDGLLAEVRALCESCEGVDRVTEIDHERAGDLVLVAQRGKWFTYDYWLDDARAPDFARTVDIHRKPGYDPRELTLGTSKAGVAWRLALRKLGQRRLLDVIPLDPSGVRGTHGRVDVAEGNQPVMLGLGGGEGDAGAGVPCTDVKRRLLAAMGAGLS
jgi:predicted AlkP superfamily pyrophosphatase or phosphodiesterase